MRQILMRGVLFILLLLANSMVFSQGTKPCMLAVSGQVLDQHTGEPLEFASVSLQPQNIFTTTNKEGRFSFSQACRGKVILAATYLGYTSALDTIHLSRDTNVKLSLEIHERFLGEVVLKEDHSPAFGTKRLKPVFIELPQHQNLASVLSSINGIRSLKTGNSIAKPMVHGMQGSRVKLLTNGIPYEGQQWGTDHAPEIDPFAMADIRLLKGVHALRYASDAIAGVILMDALPLPDSLGYSGSFMTSFSSNGRLFNQTAMARGSIGKNEHWHWGMMGTFKRGGNTSGPTYYFNNTGLQEANFTSQLKYANKKLQSQLIYSQFNGIVGVFSGAHIGNLTDLEEALAGNKDFSQSKFTYAVERPYQAVEHETLQSKTTWRFKESHSLVILLARQFNRRKEFDLHGISETDKAQLNFNITTWTADIAWEHPTFDGASTQPGALGVQVIRQANTTSGRFLIPNFIQEGLGLYWTESWRLNKWRLESALRLDARRFNYFKNVLGQVEEKAREFISPSAGLSLKKAFRQKHSLQYNLSFAWRTPTPIELFADGVHHGAARYEKGNENLDLEQVITFSTDYLYLGKHDRLELSLYANYFLNYIYPVGGLDPVLTIRGAFPLFEFQQVPAVIAGLDAQYERKWKNNWSWQSRLNITMGERLNEASFLPWMPAPEWKNQLAYDWPKKKWSPKVGVESRLVTRQWRAPIAEDYALPPNAYHLLGLSASVQKKINKRKLMISIAVQNLLNTHYRDYLNQFRYFIPEQGINATLALKIYL